MKIRQKLLEVTQNMDKMEKMPTKERILYAALNLFSEKGYDGVGVDLIAEKA